MNRCRTCGDRYPDAGDGWDGECGNCADRTYVAEFGDEFSDDDRCNHCGQIVCVGGP